MRDNIGENRIEGKNAVLECLNAKRGIKKLFVLKSLKDNKINYKLDFQSKMC